MWPSGAIFEGLFSDNSFEGLGDYTFADGRRYVGEYHRGKRHGHGKFYVDGKIREGQWVEGKEEGEFTMTVQSTG